MRARPALVAVLAVLVLLLQMPEVSAALGSWVTQLYNQDPRTFVLGWRGVLALHVIAIDTWLPVLTRTSRSLRTVRMHYAYQPPACDTHRRRRRAACPGPGLIYARPTPTCLPWLLRWFLAGFGVTNLPFAFRMHWATEPVWIFVSFSCISIGTPQPAPTPTPTPTTLTLSLRLR